VAVALEPYFDGVLGAARAGSAWAWEAIFREFAGPIASYARRRGAVEPDDVLQETLLAAARDIHRFEGDEHDFRAWIFTIAHRRVTDAFRAQGRTVQRSDADVGDAEIEARWLGDVEREAMSCMSMVEVSALLRGLSVAQRDVILLRVVADLSVEQTATVLQKSEGAVRALQSKALKALRDKLQKGR
jgi:RNA polymerase sigma factor (sigma-70 family)